MTLDEAIKHTEEVAEKNEKQASWFWGKEGNLNYENCVKCAEEHRQLAEWLRDYKRLKEQEPRWVPCSERLPEEGEVVLTQAEFEYGVEMAVSSRTDYNYWTVWGTRDINITAWMPLPTPYKAESEVRNADSN